ncbi:hypothetical protein Dimus_015300, partial [Dionaea muscipula]
MGPDSLVSQTEKAILAIGDYMNIQAHAYIGGKSVGEDIQKLEYGVHVVSGTPGRDESDEMLSRGFKDQIYDVYRYLPPELQVILESFQGIEFFYMEQAGNRSLYSSLSFRNKVVQRQDEKWWLPVSCIPSGGLLDKCRKHLKHQRDCVNRIHKAAMAINNHILNEMKVPESCMAGLPK